MKYFNHWLMGLAALALLGCGGESLEDKVKPSRLQKAYQDAPSEVKTDIDEAGEQMTRLNYVEAFQALESAVKKQKPTPEQHRVLMETLQHMQGVMTQRVNVGSKEAFQAMQEFMVALNPQYKGQLEAVQREQEMLERGLYDDEESQANP